MLALVLALVLALAEPSSAEDEGTQKTMHRRSAFERFLVEGGAWAIYAVVIIFCQSTTTTTTTLPPKPPPSPVGVPALIDQPGMATGNKERKKERGREGKKT